MDKPASYWKTASWTILMLMIFLVPGNKLSTAPEIPGLSEFIHASTFAVLFFLFSYEFTNRFRNRLKTRYALVILFFCILYGAIIETVQQISGLGRTAELSDLLFDTAGSVLAMSVILLYLKYR